MKLSKFERLMLRPEFDHIINKSQWRPDYYSEEPKPEDFGVSQDMIPDLDQELQERKKSRKSLEGASCCLTQSLYFWLPFLVMAIWKYFESILLGFVVALLIVVIAYLWRSKMDASNPELESYYDYKVALSHFEYWQRQTNIDNLRSLTGLQFEYAVGAILSRLGYQVTVTKASGDGGIDIIAEDRDRAIKLAIQCKNQKGKLGPAVVREMLGSINGGSFSGAAIVSSGGFSEAACELARLNGILLFDDFWLCSPWRPK